MVAQKALIFICSRVSGMSEKKLSHRIAKYLERAGVGDIGDVQALGTQHSLDRGQRRKMIFVNDCNSSCVKMLTHGLQPEEYLYIDVSKEKNRNDFDVERFCRETVSLSLMQPVC